MSTADALILTVLGAAVVAAAAAVRSTWSPCGLSMLSTLTPTSERARGHDYRTTATWFVAGATAGGACLGLLMAGGAALVVLAGMSAGARVWAVGLAALVAAASDSRLFGRGLPVHHRQVNERWLDEYRPWVYGAGFGWQIGTGLVTYVTSSAVYLLVVLGMLTGSPVAGLLLGTGFGVLRGLAVLLTARISSTVELLSFHRRFEAARPLADGLVRAVEVAVVLAAALVLTTPAAGLLLGGGGAAVAGASALRRKAGAPGARSPEPDRERGPSVSLR